MTRGVSLIREMDDQAVLEHVDRSLSIIDAAPQMDEESTNGYRVHPR